jgi:hypothetical protein
MCTPDRLFNRFLPEFTDLRHDGSAVRRVRFLLKESCAVGIPLPLS